MCALCFCLCVANTSETQKKVAFCTPLHTIAFMDIKIGKSGNPRCPFEVRWLDAGKTKRKRFKSKGDAVLFLAALQKDKFLPVDYKMTPDERIIFKQIKDTCAEVGLPLAEICPLLRKNAHLWAVPGCEWSVAYRAFLNDLYKRGARPSTVDFYEDKCGRFFRRVKPSNILDITLPIVEEYLANYPSPEHTKRAMRPFFNFCIGKKWIAKNPFVQAKIPRILKESAPISFLSIDETFVFLSTIPPKWQPIGALLLFAGCRPFEVISQKGAPVMHVGDIDFVARKIAIRPETSKVRRLRILTHLPENLWAWLEPIRGRAPDSLIAPGSYDVWRKVKINTGLNLPKDVFRHSFASYAYHYIGAERAVEILGHVGGFAVFAKFYKALSNVETSAKYFNIYPDAKSKPLLADCQV